ncbi:MAG: MOSC domain-containing protein [Moraxellaceae bacterium]
MHISELAVYPLKSARQLRQNFLEFDAMGPCYDRRWMLVDAAGKFVTQRTHPRMCLLSAVVAGEALRLAAPGMADFLALREGEELLRVQVWEDALDAWRVSAAADAWCSEFLGMPVRLVVLPPAAQRVVSPQHAGPGHLTAFSDGFPILLVTQPSLDALNAKLSAPVDWRRFRPNIVVAGDMPAHAEDTWRRLRVGEIELAVVKPCSRCVIPSIDPETAVKNSQILTVLRGYRAREDGKTYFGQNVVITRCPPGVGLALGARVEVLE